MSVQALRKFTCAEADLLEENGIAPATVRHYPYGISVRDIIEAEWKDRQQRGEDREEHR